MEEKKNQGQLEEGKEENAVVEELDMEDLDHVAGGANPFAGVARNKDHQYSDAIRRKV